MKEIQIDKISSLKHWNLVDFYYGTFYLASKNQSNLIACIVAPHDGNGFKWLLRVANCEDFDRWSLAEMQKCCDTFEDAIDVLTSIDVEKKLKDPRLIDMEYKIVFGIATLIFGLFTIGFILFMIGVLADSFALMNFGLNALLIAYTIIIGSILLLSVGAMFDKFRSM